MLTVEASRDKSRQLLFDELLHLRRFLDERLQPRIILLVRARVSRLGRTIGAWIGYSSRGARISRSRRL